MRMSGTGENVAAGQEESQSTRKARSWTMWPRPSTQPAFRMTEAKSSTWTKAEVGTSEDAGIVPEMLGATTPTPALLRRSAVFWTLGSGVPFFSHVLLLSWQVTRLT